jgi:hypothetical protein
MGDARPQRLSVPAVHYWLGKSALDAKMGVGADAVAASYTVLAGFDRCDGACRR